MSARKLMPWYEFSLDKIEAQLQTNLKDGLSAPEVLKRLRHYGKNIFEKPDKVTLLDRFVAQVKNPLVFILLIAGVATIFLHEYVDAIVIFIALSINVVIGIAQETRASSAFEKLSQSQERFATVIRQGQKRVIPTAELVPGDVIEVRGGSYVPADARLIAETELLVNESALTGEWVEVSKDIARIEKEVPVTEQANMIWMGTLATAGSAIAVVVGTGNNTQIGAIAQSLAETHENPTPLQKSIQHLARFLVYAILATLVIIFAVGLIHSYSIFDLVLVSIAIAVAAMPEGLPAAVTVVLALGMESILKKNGLVRNLLAAETLGGTTVILTDKTGTLTMAEMRVAEVATVESIHGRTDRDLATRKPTLHEYDDDADVLKMAMLTSDAFVEGGDEPLSEWVVRGRPVERAVVLAGLESGFKQKDLFDAYPRLDFLPFESARRFVASLHGIKGRKRNRLYFSGSPELLLENSTSYYKDGKAVKMSDTDRRLLQKTQEEGSAQGMRLIAVAYKDIADETIPLALKDAEGELPLSGVTFGGFILLHDPLREDVQSSIQTAKEAGTRVIMLTGDNPITALKIAREAGIATANEHAIIGAELENMSDKELLAALETSHVFARVLPHQKLRIARILKDAGEVVAMTGDGINDAPALRKADIGVALGSGTEVAKEASDIILLNNSFSIIVSAIEEGRRVLDNLKKVVAYLLSTSFSEIAVVGAALVAGTPIPLLPTQILWTNIIEESFMNFSFAFEPKERDVMKRNPSDVSMKNILTPELKRLIFLVAGITGALLIGLYFFLLSLGLPEQELRTIMFIAVSLDSLFFTFSIKNLHRPIWQIDFFSNRYLVVSFFVSFTLLILAILLPPLQKLLSITPPTAFAFWMLVGLDISNLVIIELAKYIVFERKRQAH